jgi:hypothetical protein
VKELAKLVEADLGIAVGVDSSDDCVDLRFSQVVAELAEELR